MLVFLESFFMAWEGMLPDHWVHRVALEISGGPSFPYAREINCMGRAASMLMVRDSILADERSSGAEDGLLRKTQTEERKRRYLGLFFRRKRRGGNTEEESCYRRA